eukprot:3268415-Karenia_brevis.AAC.1
MGLPPLVRGLPLLATPMSPCSRRLPCTTGTLDSGISSMTLLSKIPFTNFVFWQDPNTWSGWHLRALIIRLEQLIRILQTLRD